LTWTSIICGHLFDSGIQSDLFGIEIDTRKVRFFNGGHQCVSSSTFATIARATVRVLEREEVSKNKMLYIQSFCISQRELLAAVQKIVGKDGWDITEIGADKLLEEKRIEGYRRADGECIRPIERRFHEEGRVWKKRIWRMLSELPLVYKKSRNYRR
jgi:hypothetical protein